MSSRLPLVGLGRRQWQRLLDFAVLVASVCFLLFIGAETFLGYGVDFRGYYAAARVVLAGGDPYDYSLVSQVLLEVTGEMGNNPYYYPPWFCLLFVPLALLSFQAAQLIWIALTLLSYWLGVHLTLKVLGWNLSGWRRWLVILSGAYLFVWLSLRSEQVGTILFALTALSLWGHQNEKPWLSGASLALLLTKPNVTWLTVPFLAVFYLVRQRRAAWWALGVLAGLLLVSTLILPGWYTHLSEPDFGRGLKTELDGPDQVKSLRLNTVLSDWLGQWGVVGVWYRAIWAALAAVSGLVLWLAWRNATGVVYMTALAGAIGLLLTPYALQYDYPPLLLALFWVYRALSRAQLPWKWAGVVILGAVFSVPLWEHPVYDGFWILLGVITLLLSLNAHLWRWPAEGVEA